MYLLGTLGGSGLVAFLIAVLVVFVVVFVVKLVLAELGVTGNIQKIIYLIIAVVAIAYLWNRFGGAI